MSFFTLLNEDKSRERRSHLKNLIAVAFADQSLDDSEVALIHRVSRRMGIDQKEVERVLDKPEKIRFYPPEKPKERFIQLYDLIAMMMADQDMDSREIELVREFGHRLGYSNEKMDELLPRLSESVANQVPPEKAYRTHRIKDIELE